MVIYIHVYVCVCVCVCVYAHARVFGLVTIYFSCLISTNYGNGRYNICMCIWIV